MLRSAGNIAILKSEVMKKTILLLDDKESIAKVVAVYLSGEYDVVYFDNALKGIQWLQEGNKPDLIISDIRMPVMRGDVHYHSVLVIDGSLQCVERRAVR